MTIGLAEESGDSLLNAFTSIVLAAFSGIGLFLCFPPFNLSSLVWVILIPLFLAIAGKSAMRGFLLSFFCGICFFLGHFNWILEIPGYTPLHHTMLALYLGSYFGIFGLAFSFISKRRNITTALFAAPFVLVSLEYVRSNLAFIALPWGLLAHSQYQVPPILQIASLTGVYGISFLIVIVNSALAAMAYLFLGRLRKDKGEGLGGEKWVVVTAAVLIAFTLVYGQVIISNPIEGKEIKVSIVQGNIEQEMKWDRRHAKFIMQTYADLTQKASKEAPDLIVWPETATPRSINRDPELYNHVIRISKATDTNLLLGSSHHRKFKGKDSKNVTFFNSAFLIKPEGKVKKQRYDKIRLFPFGEYLPLKETIPWSAINVHDVPGTVPGKEFTIFGLHDLRFGVTICWENIFPDLFRQFVKAGAQFIINITNEAWFGETAAPYQFVSMSVMRAVENRVYVVRCANTGVSCFIDPYGRVVDRVKNSTGKDIFVRGILTGSVIPQESKTFYTQYGDWIVWLSFLSSAIFLVIALLKKNPKSKFEQLSRAGSRNP